MESLKEPVSYAGEYAFFKINPKIYPLDVVHSAAYIMIDKAFILLDGDPEKEIIVKIQRKEQAQDLNKLVQEFNEELLNYAVYKSQSEKNQDLREAIMKRVLLTNEVIDCLEEIRKDIPASRTADPKNILTRWEDAQDKPGKQPDTK